MTSSRAEPSCGPPGSHGLVETRLRRGRTAPPPGAKIKSHVRQSTPPSLFRGLFDLDRDLDTLFESGGTWWPAVEARTKDGELVLRCDLPGVDPSDIEVSLEGTTLTISGERRSEREEKEDGRRLSEVRYGRFERSLTVPDGIDPEKVTARYENGVLEVTLPLPAGHAPRRVPIQLKGHGSKKAA